MKKLIFITIVILLYSCETSPCGNIGFKAVCVTIENSSGTEIKYIELKHKNGTEQIQMLGSGESGHMSFDSNGENSYELSLGFITGKKLTTSEYTEDGYQISHQILKDTIVTSYY